MTVCAACPNALEFREGKCSLCDTVWSRLPDGTMQGMIVTITAPAITTTSGIGAVVFESEKRLHCDYCGDLNWTLKQYHRVTHKHACPHRTDGYCQQHADCGEF